MKSARVPEVNDSNFASTVLTSPLPVIVDFTAAWCAPCRAIAPHVAAIAEHYAGKVRVYQCDVDSNHAVSAQFDVRSMPTLLMFKQGKVVGQLVGAVPRHRIQSMVDQAIANETGAPEPIGDHPTRDGQFDHAARHS